MQHIPDNEFDRLFKDRLMDAEVQAPVDLWDRIAPQIAPKKKRNTGLYWSAAATVLIAVSAGLLFKPQEKIALHAPTVLTAAKRSSAQPLSVDSQAEHKATAVYADVPAASVDRVNHRSLSENSIEIPVATLVEIEKNSSAVQPNDEENHHHIIAAVQEPVLAITQPAQTSIKEPIIIQPEVDVEEPIATTALVETAEHGQESRPRIRNAGDLVNFVVDKLDKREQKFLEFRTDEDESSSLVAINIGPLKINQRRK